MLTDPTLPISAAAVAALGFALAQRAGPLANDWSGSLRRRLLGLPKAAPSRVRRAVGAALVSLTLTGGAVLAYAAEPSGPDMLPKEVVGVMGSGDQLSLTVARDQKIVTLKPGEEYRDGWTLKALTNTTATLNKGSETREVGLNPTGALPDAAPTGDPSTVQVAGMTLEAARSIENAYIQEFWTATGVTNGGLDFKALQAYLGPARYQAFMDNETKLEALARQKSRADALARGDFNAVRYYDGLPVAGPDSFPATPVQGQELYASSAAAAGLPSSVGYALGPPLQNAGGLTFYKCYAPQTPAGLPGCP